MKKFIIVMVLISAPVLAYDRTLPDIPYDSSDWDRAVRRQDQAWQQIQADQARRQYEANEMFRANQASLNALQQQMAIRDAQSTLRTPNVIYQVNYSRPHGYVVDKPLSLKGVYDNDAYGF